MAPPFEEVKEEWEAALDLRRRWVANLVRCELSHEKTALQLFELFDVPDDLPNTELFYYSACAELLEATREYSDAGEHIALIAGLFALFKAEGLKRDGPRGESVFGNSVFYPTLRQLAAEIPAPPGYTFDEVSFALERDPGYVKGESYAADLAEYARKHEGQIRFWSLVGRIDADGLLGSDRPGLGVMPLLVHGAPVLLRALEDPVNRGVWETLWAAVLRCDEEMAYGQWGSDEPERLGKFKDAARKIAGDETAPLVWRGRFALMLEELEKQSGTRVLPPSRLQKANMESRPNLVVVTGGTGHVGAMIIDQLLKDGFSVRATARPAKVEALKRTYPDAKGKLEVAEMADIVSDAGKWPEILQGADAVIHTACPVYHPGLTSEYIYTSSNEGIQRLLDAVGKSSVKRFILTGSIGAFFRPDFSSLMDNVTYDHNTWSEIDDIDPKEHDPAYTYIACKAISEKLAWKAAEKYPHIDFTAIHPSQVMGWCLKDYPAPKVKADLNANKFWYEVIEKGHAGPVNPLRDVVHNRDVARAHVLALAAPVLPKGEKKRLIVSSGTMAWADAFQFLKEPEIVAKFQARGHDIVSRLPDLSAVGMQSQYLMDASLTEKVLGMKKEEYIHWKDILLEVMLCLMDWEKTVHIV
ncbi:hypothetical protein GGX14DRAFT_657841 [Mycena pura]|uniref:NAD-dependent epimerase/dehydratase domain-containing protein n=1 Tax=Mycena pura TaxID=153505 RepID=A0AAD6YLW0_9AGAR|nr:hypothetical protein GGX14DRAFT_657841 [Mycena pura]